MSSEQKIRSVLFYLSVLIFFSGLPFILSFALGYKFDRQTLSFKKTGLLVVKTQPAGAHVYLDHTLLNNTTPITLNELMPRNYLLELSLEGHYPYVSEVAVEAGKVTKLEKIMLFPQRPDIKKISTEAVSAFLVDETKNSIYYLNHEENGIYRSDLEGNHFKLASYFLALTPAAERWKLSGDRESLLYYNSRQIGISKLFTEKELASLKGASLVFVIEYASADIKDVFWHSDNYHLIIVGGTRIDIIEAQAGAKPVTLLQLNTPGTVSFYDTRTDTLYFMDAQKGADGKIYNNAYKLELNKNANTFRELMRLGPNLEKRFTNGNEKE